jgi:hypothetical protein
MEPPTSLPPTKLLIRTYACKLSAKKVKLGLLKLVETSPAFNESWINGEFDVGSRIGGLHQYGDIIIRHRTVRAKSELTIEHRAGDDALAREIETLFEKSLTPKAPRMVKGNTRPQGMAYFFEMIRGSVLKHKVLLTDSVIEAAHDLDFDDYRAARSKLEFLRKLPRLSPFDVHDDPRLKKDFQEAAVVHAKPKVCLYQGKKLALTHKLSVPAEWDNCVLTLHFAILPGFKVLIGWVEEKQF